MDSTPSHISGLTTARGGHSTLHQSSQGTSQHGSQHGLSLPGSPTRGPSRGRGDAASPNRERQIPQSHPYHQQDRQGETGVGAGGVLPALSVHAMHLESPPRSPSGRSPSKARISPRSPRGGGGGSVLDRAMTLQASTGGGGGDTSDEAHGLGRGGSGELSPLNSARGRRRSLQAESALGRTSFGEDRATAAAGRKNIAHGGVQGVDGVQLQALLEEVAMHQGEEAAAALDMNASASLTSISNEPTAAPLPSHGDLDPATSSTLQTDEPSADLSGSVGIESCTHRAAALIVQHFNCTTPFYLKTDLHKPQAH